MRKFWSVSSTSVFFRIADEMQHHLMNFNLCSISSLDSYNTIDVGNDSCRGFASCYFRCKSDGYIRFLTFFLAMIAMPITTLLLE
jgi:hypothetical protein